MGTTTFAICLRSRPDRIDGILMVVDEREEADEIAADLRERGQDVVVRELKMPPRPADDA